MPKPWREGAWPCPKCHRPLIGEGKPGRSLRRWAMLHPVELANECLVCGSQPADRDGVLTDVESIRSEAVRMAEQLRDADDRRWPRRLEAAAAQDDLYDLGHYLHVLRRDRCVEVERAWVSRLMYAVGITLSPEGSR